MYILKGKTMLKIFMFGDRSGSVHFFMIGIGDYFNLRDRDRDRDRKKSEDRDRNPIGFFAIGQYSDTLIGKFIKWHGKARYFL